MILTDEFKQALDLLETGRHMFLTGKAGTGKSTLVRHFLAHTDRKVIVAAPTGIAALNVDGTTIHALFGFRPTTTLQEVLGEGYRPSRFASALRAIDSLIIDETSMVRADVFDMVAAALERYGPSPGAEFGGVQIVLVGDLYQLPPVVTEAEEEYFRTRYQTPYFFSAKSFQRENFPTVALTTVFRQLGDDRLTSILNEIREGVLLGHARDQLNKRVDAEFRPPDDEFWLTLAPTNRIVEVRNNQQLERLQGEEVVHLASKTGDLTLFEPPTAETLCMKVGAQIMMLTNDPSGKWVNGTLGRIVEICRDSSDLVTTVEFNTGARHKVSPYTWEATRPSVVNGSLKYEVTGTFTQLPFKLAWAITIHKSQGQTLDHLIVDLSGGTFAFGQLYVALSRCTSLEGLVLKKPVLPRDLKRDPRIARFLRAAITGERVGPHCGIAVLAVGKDDRYSKPRAVELAIAFEDGSVISTIVNPQRDLEDAGTKYGIHASDVLFAPTLAEAWGLIAPMLAGLIPVGVDIDATLRFIDVELKRLGYVTQIPVGVDVPLDSLHPQDRRAAEAGPVEDRARAALQALTYARCNTMGSGPFDDHEPSDALSGHLLFRSQGSLPPTSFRMPELSSLLELSRYVSPALLGRVSDSTDGSERFPASTRSVLADQLRKTALTVPQNEESIARLRRTEKLLGIAILDADCIRSVERPHIDAVLQPGARVCFTGSANDPTGRHIEKDELKEMAGQVGLVPVDAVTKSKCDALIAAELGSQSRKAKQAAKFSKPVFGAAEFLAWIESISTSMHETRDGSGRF
ncbi:MAG: AAA family ATPase [Mycobacterium sp.]